MFDQKEIDGLLQDLEQLKSHREHIGLFMGEIKKKIDNYKANKALLDSPIVRDLDFLMFSIETYDKHITDILQRVNRINGN